MLLILILSVELTLPVLLKLIPPFVLIRLTLFSLPEILPLISKLAPLFVIVSSDFLVSTEPLTVKVPALFVIVVSPSIRLNGIFSTVLSVTTEPSILSPPAASFVIDTVPDALIFPFSVICRAAI